MTIPACAGRWDLFDSTDLNDHHEAAALCATCPMLTDCQTAALDTPAPEGTWAGALYSGVIHAAKRENPPRRRSPKVAPACGTEPGYQRHRAARDFTCQPCREAHNAHNRAIYAERTSA